MSMRWGWAEGSAPKAGFGMKRMARTSNNAPRREESSTKTKETKERIL
jgi:hypothetical protein